MTSRDQDIECIVRATDGLAKGFPGIDSVFVRNSLPTQPDVRILPLIPTPDDGLAVFIVNDSVDLDEDDIVYLIEWYESRDAVNWTRRSELSGNPEARFFGERQIISAFTQVSEFWRIDVTPIEVSSLPTVPSGFGKNPTQPSKQIISGELGTHRVFVLPDLNGDNVIDFLDLLAFEPLWQVENEDLDINSARLFFEPGTLPTQRIGPSELFDLLEAVSD